MKPEARDSRGDNEHHEAKVAVFFFIDVFDDMQSCFHQYTAAFSPRLEWRKSPPSLLLLPLAMAVGVAPRLLRRERGPMSSEK